MIGGKVSPKQYVHWKPNGAESRVEMERPSHSKNGTPLVLRNSYVF